jgi:hypothetical protein
MVPQDLTYAFYMHSAAYKKEGALNWQFLSM